MVTSKANLLHRRKEKLKREGWRLGQITNQANIKKMSASEPLERWGKTPSDNKEIASKGGKCGQATNRGPSPDIAYVLAKTRATEYQVAGAANHTSITPFKQKKKTSKNVGNSLGAGTTHSLNISDHGHRRGAAEKDLR